MKCLLEFCTSEANGSRGLCRTHYNWVKGRVDRGQYVWDELEKLGMALPARSDVQSAVKKKFDAMVAKRLEEYGKN